MKVKALIYPLFLLALILFGTWIVISSNSELKTGFGIYIADYGLENDRYDWSMSACDWVLEENPNNPDVLKRKVKLLMRLERYDEAYSLQRTVVESEDTVTVSDWETLGLLGVKNGDYKVAVSAYESALLDINAVEISGSSLRSEYLDEKASLLIKLQRYDEAVFVYNSLIENNPDNASLWVSLGDAYLYKSLLANGQLKDMYNTLNLEKPVRTSSASFDMSAFESHRKAIDAYNKAVELDPMIYPLIAAKILGNYEKTINSYQDILKGLNG
ncbi:MAG: tetratricopeptide repeat protein [Methanomicrobium sp.]|nr:tetratricopeptide repeat protein [Methanomicrobium sp.]